MLKNAKIIKKNKEEKLVADMKAPDTMQSPQKHDGTTS